MTISTSKNWRLIVTPPLPGEHNMAIDEALLRLFDPASSLPVLRLYGWSPPALSLGRFQKPLEELDLERCRADGVALVRRITGGGALYHADELTYSLVCSPQQIPPASSIKDSFRVLTAFLLDFYRSFDLDAGYALDAAPDKSRLGERSAFCFAGRESFDILVGGRKIGGNAQRRTRGIIFQHGSIPLLNRAETGLSCMRDSSPETLECVTSLDECGVTLGRELLLQRLATAFGRAMGVELLSGDCTAAERAWAERLVESKYATERWNLEGVGE